MERNEKLECEIVEYKKNTKKLLKGIVSQRVDIPKTTEEIDEICQRDLDMAEWHEERGW